MKSKILRFFLGYENPINLYEKSPFLAWIVIGGLIVYGLWGFFVILK